MGTFVLVPGAYCGGWIWREVTGRIRRDGDQAHSATLTGLGERVHLGHPGVDLSLHIEDIIKVIEFEDLDSVFLVGWSYGGMVIAGVADAIPERIAHLVYLDAAEPEDGQSVYDIAGEDSRAEEEEQARRYGDGWRVPPPPESNFANPAHANLFIEDAAKRHWCVSKFAPHPIKTMSERIRRSVKGLGIPRTHIVGTVGRTGESLARKRAQLQLRPGGRYVEITANHMMLVTAAGEVSDALTHLA